MPLALVVLLLGGCRLDVTTEVVVDDDGAGTLALSLVVDEELAQRLGAAGAAPEDLLPRVPDGGRWSVAPSEEGAGVVLVAAFAEPAGLRAAFDDLVADLDADDGAVLVDPVLVRTADGGLRLALEGGLVPPAVLGTAPVGAPGGGEDLAEELRRRGDDLATATLRATFATVPVVVSGRGVVEGTTAVVTLPVGELARVVVVAPPRVTTTSDLVVGSVSGAGAALVLALLAAGRSRARRRG